MSFGRGVVVAMWGYLSSFDDPVYVFIRWSDGRNDMRVFPRDTNMH
jgi:uncharacterized protein (UPF0297 family)